jgi:hypothetical protein
MLSRVDNIIERNPSLIKSLWDNVLTEKYGLLVRYYVTGPGYLWEPELPKHKMSNADVIDEKCS